MQPLVDPHHHVRRRHQVPKAVGGKRKDFGKRLARHQFGHKLLGDRHRDLDRLGLEPRLDRAEPAIERLERGSDPLQRDRGMLLGLCLGRGEAFAIADGFRVREPRPMLGQRHG
jgi:hypothetical protein